MRMSVHRDTFKITEKLNRQDFEMAEIRTHFVSEDDKVFLENCQSSCFICAKALPSQNVQEGESYERECSIRTVFRHLKINPVVNSDFHPPGDWMPFCEHCYLIFTTLSSYCADFEILQMRIRYFLNELNKLIVKDTRHNDRTINNIRKQLKTKLVEKCTYNSQTGPFVVLTQLDVEQITSIANQATGAHFLNLSDDEYEPEEDDMVEMSDDQCQSSNVDSESEKAIPSKNKSKNRKQSTSNTGHGSGSSSQKIFPCLECGCEFKCKDSLNEHSPLFHPEKHFPSKTKSDNLTLPQYKMYLTHLLNTEVDSCGSYKSGGYNCAYCPKTFKKQRRHTLRLHLTKTHQDQLLKNLNQLQKDVSIDKLPIIVIKPDTVFKMRSSSKSYIKKQEDPEREKNSKLKQYCKIKKRMKPEHTCSICEVRTTSLRKHEALHHPEKFLLSKRSEEISIEQFKLYCVYLINKHVENFTKSKPDKKVKFQCPYCENSYIDLQGCRNHLVLGHVSLLLNEIEQVQKTVKPDELKTVQKTLNTKAKYYVRSTNKVVEITTMKCKVCDVRLTRRGMLLHMKKNHPNEYIKSYDCDICDICKQAFRSKWWLDFHKTSCHADVLFQKWKANTIAIEQFKTYCENVVRDEVDGLEQVGGEKDGNTRYKCSYCVSTFGDTVYAQVHLVMEHNDILGSKLGQLQGLERVGETGQEMVIKMEESEVIIEADEDFEATEIFCDKGGLKVEVTEDWDGNGEEMVEDIEELNEVSVGKVNMEIKEEDCKMDGNAILPD